MGQFVFVKNQYEAEHASRVFSSEQFSFVPIMPTAAVWLRQNGFDNIKLPIDYLERDERNTIFFEAYEMSKNYLQLLKEQLLYRDIDIAECLRLQMLPFLQDVLTAQLFIRKFILEAKPTRCLFYHVPKIASFGNHIHDGTSDVFEGIVQWELRQVGVSFEFVSFAEERDELAFNARREDSKKRYSNYSKKRLNICDVPTDKKLIIGFGVDYDLFIIWPYMKALSAEYNAQPILISDSENIYQTSNRSGLSLEDEFSYIFVGDIGEDSESSTIYASKEKTLKETVEAIKKTLISAVLSNDFLPTQLNNPFSRIQFETMCDASLAQIIKHINIAYSFLSSHDVYLFVDDYCAGEVNRAWHQVCAKCRVLSMTVPHGAINLVEFYDFAGSFGLVFGSFGKKLLEEFLPHKSKNIIIAGDPIMQKLDDSLSEVQCSDVEINANNKKTVLLMTTGFLHQVWTDIDVEGFLKTWRGIVDVAMKHADWRFIIKPHPSNRDWALWYKKLPTCYNLRNLEVVDDLSLEIIIKDIPKGRGCGVLIGKPGTAGLVCALSGMPFAYLDSMLCRDVLGYKIWNENNGVPRLDSICELEVWVDKMLNCNESRKQALDANLAFREFYLQEFNISPITTALVSSKFTPVRS